MSENQELGGKPPFVEPPPATKLSPQTGDQSNGDKAVKELQIGAADAEAKAGVATTERQATEHLMENAGEYKTGKKLGWFGGEEVKNPSELKEIFDKNFAKKGDGFRLGDKHDDLVKRLEEIKDGTLKGTAGTKTIEEARKEVEKLRKVANHLKHFENRADRMSKPYTKAADVIRDEMDTLKAAGEVSMSGGGPDDIAKALNERIKNRVTEKLKAAGIEENIERYVPQEMFTVAEVKGKKVLQFVATDIEKETTRVVSLGEVTAEGVIKFDKSAMSDAMKAAEKWGTGMETVAEKFAEKAGDMRKAAEQAIEKFEKETLGSAEEKLLGAAKGIVDKATTTTADEMAGKLTRGVGTGEILVGAAAGALLTRALSGSDDKTVATGAGAGIGALVTYVGLGSIRKGRAAQNMIDKGAEAMGKAASHGLAV